MNYQNEILPKGAILIAVTPEMTEKTVMNPILKKHMAPRDKYGYLRVSRGSLQFQWEDDGTIFDADPTHPVVIFPERFHHVIITGEVSFRIEFYRVMEAGKASSPCADAERPGEAFLAKNDAPEKFLNCHEIMRAFYFRHACKEFEPGKIIPDADFDCILESARLSPSSFGFEPWHFLVIRDKALRMELQPLIWGGARQIPSCSHLVLTLSKKSYFMHWDSEYIRHMERDVLCLPQEIIAMYQKHLRDFEEKDFELMESDRALCDWAAHQTYIPLTNMMMTAAYLGKDSCPMEGFCKRELNEFLAHKKLMDLSEYSVAHGLAFGYRLHKPREKRRQALSEIVTFV